MDEDEAYYNDDDPPMAEDESQEKAEAMLNRILNRSTDPRIIHYAIHKKVDDTLIGGGDISSIDTYNRRCIFGITLGFDKQNWGKGYATEALEAVIAYCFTELDMNRIEAEIYAFNSRSIRLFERLGFQREGVKRQCVYKDGVFKDEYVYALLKEDWHRGK
jgi:ribosomal-protein-alanine N-acetyltransferase